MGGLLRTLESEIGLYETDYTFVSSGYPPRVEARMDQLDFFTQSIAGFDWVCIRPWNQSNFSFIYKLVKYRAGPGKRMLHATKSHMSVQHCSIRLTAFYYIVAYQAFNFYSMLSFLVERWQKKHL